MSRKEVDPARIGVHGISGGGTQTAYISAVDDRVLASAPACYITSYRRLMESIGVQDGEQNFYHGILVGIDHADFLEVRAPKPALIMATTRDFFSIQGTRETCQEVRRVYELFGRPDLSSHLPRALLAARALSGYAEPSPDEEPVFTGRFQREGYAVEK